tara:strand:+ start:231 stop:1190 length:960 start_codon:yes stop_codon:yes gene_type:complete
MPKKISIDFEVDAEDSGKRIDVIISKKFPEFSRMQIKKFIELDFLSIDCKKISKVSEKVPVGSKVSLSGQIDTEVENLPQNIEIEIKKETKDFIVINKAPGIVVHPGSGNKSGTILNSLLFNFPELADLPRAGIIHRLDKDTSGLMVIARNDRAYKHLSDQISSRTVKRGYDLIVIGRTLRAGTLEFPIGRHRTVRTKQSVTEKGKEAITKFKVLEFLGFYTYIRAYLGTGRTHQIRVHFSHIKHPLVGDKTYGTSQRFAKNTSDDLKDFIIKFPRQALHATELSFIDPSSSETVNFQSKIPKDFQNLLDRLKTNENLT